MGGVIPASPCYGTAKKCSHHRDEARVQNRDKKDQYWNHDNRQDMGRMGYSLMGGKPGQQEPNEQATGVPHKDRSRVKIIEEKSPEGPP